MATGFFLHPSAVLHDTGWGHPEHQGRLRAVAAAVKNDAAALGDRVEYGEPDSEPGSASEEALARVHSPELLKTVRRAVAEAEERGRPVGVAGDADTMVSGASWEAAAGSAGAGLDAVRAVAKGRFRNAFVATRPPGHHATPHRAMGFCLVNNVAVAAADLRARGHADRMLIVDWDVHHGNGTQDVFYDDPSVFFVSLHQHPHYPGTGAAAETGRGRGEGFTLNVPLPAATPRDRYMRLFAQALETSASRFEPDFVLASAGFDVLAGDPLGGQLLEPEDLHVATSMLMEVADRFCGGRLAVFLEGGYDPARTGQGCVATLRALAGLEWSQPGSNR